MTRKILIVDDNRDLAECIAELLEDEGWEVHVEDNPKRAARQGHQQPFDVGLLDVHMPGMDGIELHERLRATNPGARYVMMTAYSTDERLDLLRDRGVMTVLPKPVPLDALMAALEGAAVTEP